MKKTFYIYCLLLLTVTIFAQRQTDYNLKGDEAMERLEYEEAKIHYQRGVPGCNSYSINQLTKIWFADESMHASMRYVMGKCLECLDSRATEMQDTASINKLILYYTEGIGTPVNEGKANFWREQLATITGSNTRPGTNVDNPYVENPYVEDAINKERTQREAIEREKNRTRFFFGYSYNALAPVGLKVGVLGKSVGGYVCFNSNLSNQQADRTFDSGLIIPGLDNVGYAHLGNKKMNAMLITGGLIFKPSQQFLISVGGGYVKRELFYDFKTTDLTVTDGSSETFWAKYDEPYEGAVMDLDGTLIIGKHFYISLGGSLLKFKNFYGNAGIGVFF
ncbi:MAG: hypothetical protein LBE91_02500 [Tannerella sp.]|jgi:hypothetical protein|nr:hypothetical protein [Tannerella sp.]